MVIIIEGPDNVGKSTLIRNIKNHYNKNIIANLAYSNVKQATPHEHINYSKLLYKNMFELCNFQSKVLNNIMILDRSHIGEMVYSPLYRNYSGDYVLDIEKEFDLSNYFLITLTDLAENLIDRDDGLSHSINVSDKNKELELFLESTTKSLIKHKFVMNINGLNITQVFNKVIDFIEYNKG